MGKKILIVFLIIIFFIIYKNKKNKEENVGNDTVSGFGGSDTLNDSFLAGDVGSETVFASVEGGAWTLTGGTATTAVTDTDNGFVGDDILAGGGGNDTIDLSWILAGGGGNVTLAGEGGNVTLAGEGEGEGEGDGDGDGDGDDILAGGGGNDTIDVSWILDNASIHGDQKQIH